MERLRCDTIQMFGVSMILFQKFIFLFTKDALKSEYNDYNITKGLYLK